MTRRNPAQKPIRLRSHEILRHPLIVSTLALSLVATTAGTVPPASAAPPETGVARHAEGEHQPAIRVAAEQPGLSAEPQEKKSEGPEQPSSLSRSVKKNISFRALGT